MLFMMFLRGLSSFHLTVLESQGVKVRIQNEKTHKEQFLPWHLLIVCHILVHRCHLVTVLHQQHHHLQVRIKMWKGLDLPLYFCLLSQQRRTGRILWPPTKLGLH
uniref:Uncharacterized protein n=1 Tax=Cannabis sativa TaxID=3483 RepID=A0A803R4W0_CANSA